MAEEGEPLAVVGAGGEEGQGGEELVTVAEALDQAPALLRLHATPEGRERECIVVVKRYQSVFF